MNAIQFYNFSNEDFTWKWDGVAYTFPAGETMFLEDFKAEHFAQHLVDRELNKRGVPTNNMVERQALGARCFPSVETVTPLEALQKNEKKKKAVKEDVEFAGLKDTDRTPKKPVHKKVKEEKKTAVIKDK